MRIVVVGAGLAGLVTALELAPLPVTVITAAALGEGASSAWAQGGIAAALAAGDSPAMHARDTIAAGAGIVDIDVARIVTEAAPARIRELLRLGVPFDRGEDGSLVQSREAAHSAKRVVRVTGDRAGHAIMQAVIVAVQRSASIRVMEQATAVDFMVSDRRVSGVVCLVGPPEAPRRVEVAADVVVLATGGIGGLYAVTTNPPQALGQGIAMAARAGAAIADAEFVQFHPTAIDIGRDPAPLATEALRGEGALLIDKRGRRFMPDHHRDAELAPRDIVARAVHAQIAGGQGAFLDCRAAIGVAFAERFPTVYAACMSAGIDPVIMPIPIAPAEHYHMGGVVTDANGRTGVTGVWAVGEVAATGLHGANRLASNSLLEGVVMAARAAADIVASGPAEPKVGKRRQTKVVTEAGTEMASIDPARRERALSVLRRTMADHLGVMRDDAGLRQAISVIERLRSEAGDDIVLANAALAAHFVAEAALRRKESRGGHYRTDHPEADPRQQRRSRMTLAGLALRARAAEGALPLDVDPDTRPKDGR